MNAPKELSYPRFCVAGNTIYFSGMGALGENGKLVEGGFKEHVEQALRNIEAALADAKVTKAHIVRVAVKVVHISYQPVLEEAYAKFLDGYDDHPARTFDAGSQFPFGSLVEIEVTATYAPVRRERLIMDPDYENRIEQE